MANEFAVEMQDVVKQFVTPEGGILAADDGEATGQRDVRSGLVPQALGS